MTHSTLLEIAPQDVHQVVARPLLVDAFDFVFDLEKSQGAWLHDSKTGRKLLDFMTFIASTMSRVSPAETLSPTLTKAGAPGSGVR